jgi:hypothetical protein
MRGRRLYLNAIGGRGPAPRRRGEAVLARGRGLQGVSLIKLSMIIPSVVVAYKDACHCTLANRIAN